VAEPPAALLDWLVEAQAAGALGPGDVRAHIEHAERFAAAVGEPPTGPALDLGTGAGVPGLLLALRWPASQWVLLDGRPRRTEPLAAAVERLGLGDRVGVVCQRAEEAGHDPTRRQQFALVVSRSFAAPAPTAECGGALVAVGGKLVVSEPPASASDGAAGRWPAEPLRQLGLEPVAGSAGVQVLAKVGPTPADRPRRTGVPAKRPLF
jgi:16S rRNA (guanine527-N7)-methyltransferase